MSLHEICEDFVGASLAHRDGDLVGRRIDELPHAVEKGIVQRRAGTEHVLHQACLLGHGYEAHTCANGSNSNVKGASRAGSQRSIRPHQERREAGASRGKRLSAFAPGEKVLPDLLEHARIDHPGVAFLRLLVRIQHELDGPALRPERAGVKDVEAFVDRLALGDALFELERMDGRHLGVAAEGAHPREPGLDVLDRRAGKRPVSAPPARHRRPEALHQLRRHADQQHRRKVRDVLGPVAEVHERAHQCRLRVRHARASARSAPRLLRLVLRAVDEHGRHEGDVEVGRGHLVRIQVARRGAARSP